MYLCVLYRMGSHLCVPYWVGTCVSSIGWVGLHVLVCAGTCKYCVLGAKYRIRHLQLQCAVQISANKQLLRYCMKLVVACNRPLVADFLLPLSFQIPYSHNIPYPSSPFIFNKPLLSFSSLTLPSAPQGQRPTPGHTLPETQGREDETGRELEQAAADGQQQVGRRPHGNHAKPDSSTVPPECSLPRQLGEGQSQ